MVPADVAIRVTSLGKLFRIYEKPEDRLKESIYPIVNRLLGLKQKRYCREFEALKDVSFEVKKGETIGIVGCNGSGKSTLLQLICGTLTPTSGSVVVQGRVAALLELGSGFNPEFTGRENVYMNAVILGMTAQEVADKFDEIEAFADIGDFIEQPVKTYSSGMTLRLAFAVIAHVNADILIIDEALSVGDALFTQKCMRFVQSFQRQGTLLFVSHDTAAVQNLCQSSIWLEKGQLKLLAASKDVAEAYLQSTLQAAYGDEHQLSSIDPTDSPAIASETVDAPKKLAVDYEAKMSVHDNFNSATGWKTGAAELLSVDLESCENDDSDVFRGGEHMQMTIRAIAHKCLPRPIVGFLVKDRLGQILFGENTLLATNHSPVEAAGGEKFKATFDFTLPMLANGEYVVMASVADGELEDNIQHHHVHDALVITVSSSKVRWGLTGVPFERISMEITNE
ncbi:MAG: ABC transporter ATP-binding protein [Gammaproteobacteria bacterium]|nr:ABC transporter ATP-binding protein [Gammaproteobacteria bacterium]